MSSPLPPPTGDPLFVPFQVYDLATGKLKRYGRCPPPASRQVKAGEGLLTVFGDGDRQYVAGSPATLTARPASGVTGSVSSSPRGVLLEGVDDGAQVRVTGDANTMFYHWAGSPEDHSLFLSLDPGTYAVTVEQQWPKQSYAEEFVVT